MADHKPGHMDVEAQEKTFDGFIRLSVRAIIVVLVVLVLLAIWNA